MLQNLAWQATDTLTRAQFSAFEASCEESGMRDADRRLALGLDEQDWAAWRDFLVDGPLPSDPKLPDMLQRLAVATYRVSVTAAVFGTDRGLTPAASMDTHRC
jgi:hypothetical protein